MLYCHTNDKHLKPFGRDCGGGVGGIKIGNFLLKISLNNKFTALRKICTTRYLGTNVIMPFVPYLNTSTVFMPWLKRICPQVILCAAH